jgi:hypothetical protein
MSFAIPSRITLAAMAGAALLAGCATPPPATIPVNEYANMLDPWRGQTEQALVARWGTPQAVEDTGGGRWLTYVDVDQPSQSTFSFGIGGFGVGGGGGHGSSVGVGAGATVPINGAPPKGCVTHFLIENGHVTRWTVDGTVCRPPA